METTLLLNNINKVNLNKDGIYLIINISIRKVYIGQSVYLLKRFKEHERKLRLNNHHNYDLQNDYNNGDDFKFIPIKNYKRVSLNRMEKFFIKKHNTFFGYGYNSHEGGNSFGIGKNNPKYDSTLYTFYHKDGRVEKSITQYDMRKKHNLSELISSLCRKKIKTHLNWRLTKKLPIPKHNSIIYTFYHKDGRVEKSITQYDMRKKHKLEPSDLSSVCNAHQKTTKGWRLTKDPYVHKHNKASYTFYHNNGNVEENITQYDMRKKYNLNITCLNEVCNKKQHTTKGWGLSKSVVKNIIVQNRNKKYTFYNIETNIIEKDITQTQLAKKHNLSLKNINMVALKKRKSHKKWMLFD